MFNFYVTGCNSGLGKSIISQFEDDDEFKAICKKKGFLDTRSFLKLDLSNMKDVGAFEFEILNNNKINVLINNAGSLGEINQFIELDTKNLIDTFNINFISPSILMSKFINKNKALNNLVLVVNIVSNMTKVRVPSLSLYATSKKALINLTKEVSVEFKELNIRGVSVINIDPGMIDTNMQKKLRCSSYSHSDFFISRHEKFGLNSPKKVASKIVNFIKNKSWECGKNYHFSEL